MSNQILSQVKKFVWLRKKAGSDLWAEKDNVTIEWAEDQDIGYSSADYFFKNWEAFKTVQTVREIAFKNF